MTENKNNFPEGYHILTTENLITHLANNQICQEKLGSDSSTWQVSELSDGNINDVFLLESPKAKLIIKQSLPYIRIIKDWPLKLQRIEFENAALQSQMKITPDFVPSVYYYDEKMYFIIMEYLAEHIILRKGMIDAIEYPNFAEDISSFLAHNLFYTSDFHLDTKTKRQLVAKFSLNSEMCKIAEDVIFTQPFIKHDNNHWTTPYLDETVATIQSDPKIKIKVNELKEKFLTKTEALIHADLHTGSIMVTKDSTKVIDAEFAFMGPMAFDIGKLFANLIINYYSQVGHEKENNDRQDYQTWVLYTMIEIWQLFNTKLQKLFFDRQLAVGDLIPQDVFLDDQASNEVLNKIYNKLIIDIFSDALGFCATCIVRRIVGIAHNLDLESIDNQEVKANCEQNALNLAIWLLSNNDLSSIDINSFTKQIQNLANSENK